MATTHLTPVWWVWWPGGNTEPGLDNTASCPCVSGTMMWWAQLRIWKDRETFAGSHTRRPRKSRLQAVGGEVVIVHTWGTACVLRPATRQ